MRSIYRSITITQTPQEATMTIIKFECVIVCSVHQIISSITIFPLDKTMYQNEKGTYYKKLVKKIHDELNRLLPNVLTVIIAEYARLKGTCINSEALCVERSGNYNDDYVKIINNAPVMIHERIFTVVDSISDVESRENIYKTDQFLKKINKNYAKEYTFLFAFTEHHVYVVNKNKNILTIFDQHLIKFDKMSLNEVLKQLESIIVLNRTIIDNIIVDLKGLPLINNDTNIICLQIHDRDSTLPYLVLIKNKKPIIVINSIDIGGEINGIKYYCFDNAFYDCFSLKKETLFFVLNKETQVVDCFTYCLVTLNIENGKYKTRILKYHMSITQIAATENEIIIADRMKRCFVVYDHRGAILEQIRHGYLAVLSIDVDENNIYYSTTSNRKDFCVCKITRS
jgi:hypothetical protein